MFEAAGQDRRPFDTTCVRRTINSRLDCRTQWNQTLLEEFDSLGEGSRHDDFTGNLLRSDAGLDTVAYRVDFGALGNAARAT
jgi:hypothetical protein